MNYILIIRPNYLITRCHDRVLLSSNRANMFIWINVNKFIKCQPNEEILDWFEFGSTVVVRTVLCFWYHSRITLKTQKIRRKRFDRWFVHEQHREKKKFAAGSSSRFFANIAIFFQISRLKRTKYERLAKKFIHVARAKNQSLSLENVKFTLANVNLMPTRWDCAALLPPVEIPLHVRS